MSSLVETFSTGNPQNPKLMKYHKSRLLTVGTTLIGAVFGNLSQAAEVYIGGGDNPTGAWAGYLSGAANWRFVQQNANGYYTNNFAVERAEAQANLQSMANLFTNKNAFYETEIKSTVNITDTSATNQALLNQLNFNEKVNIDKLIGRGFNVRYASCNKNLYGARIDALQWRAWRPVLFMVPPWQISGDMFGPDPTAVFDRSKINICSGVATDGPMGFWNTNTQQMREGSYSSVKYAQNSGKRSMVMLATYSAGTGHYIAGNLAVSGQNYYNIARQCVLMHENQNAAPTVWAVSYYAAQLEQYPLVPETNLNGSPAGTVTGLAFWLIKHMRGELASLDLKPNDGLVMAADSKEGATVHHVATQDTPVSCTTQTLRYDLSNNDPHIDYAPVVAASIHDPKNEFKFAFSIGGKDCTKEMTEGGGLDMVRELRLNPGDKKELTLTVTRNTTAQNAATDSSFTLPSVQVRLHAHSTEMDRVIQTSTVEFKSQDNGSAEKMVLR
jgi:hypothetical protein